MKRYRDFVVLFVLSSCFFFGGSVAFAQYYFGRNKIQYDDFQWQILKTEHFDVYFYPEMRELAEIGAALAEEAYERLQSKMNHNITRRIPLIFYSNHAHFQQTNTTPGFLPEGIGGFFEFIKGRVVIPANGSIPQFRHVINHELVHVFTRSKMNRVLKDHRRNANAGMPLWFTEGIAEYWSAGWDSQAEMVIRDAVLSNKLVPLSQMDRIFGSYLMYKEGQAICKYIAENFGEEKLHLLIENLWKASSFSDVMKLTIGLTYKEFDQRWIYDLKKQHYPLLEDRDKPAMVSQAVTTDGVSTKPACFNRDGRDYVVFTSNRTGYSSLYMKPLDQVGKKPRILVRGERSSDFEAFHLLRSKIDVNDQEKLTFVAKSGARDAIYIFDIARRRVTRKLQFDDLVTLLSPSWSPDGRQIAFSGISYAGQSDLYIFNLETEALRRLTNDFYDDRDPAWSPDGRAIAFSSDRTHFGERGKLNLFVYDLASGRINYITYGNHNDYAPAWSPDGQYLAFSSDRDGAFNIWVIRNGRRVPPRQEWTGELTASIGHAEVERAAAARNGLSGALPYPDEFEYDFPSALDPNDELKRLTNFTTGAFDPEWGGEDRLVFTAYEEFSFQIRAIDRLTARFEAMEPAGHDTLRFADHLWAANKLAGKVEATSVKYEKKFSLDIAQSAIAQDPLFGVSGGAQVAISDMLGNQQYHFLVFNNASTRDDFFSSWNVAVTRVEKSRRVNYAVGVYRLKGRFYDRVDNFFERTQLGGFVAASYPLSVFRRVEAAINIRKERRNYDLRGEAVDGIVVSNSFSYVKDNTIWGYTGPLDGERFNFSIGHTIDVHRNDVNFTSIIVDYRRYFRLGQRTAFASRLLGRFHLGKEAYRSYMGGSWDLRLYPLYQIWGRKLFLINNELRFPFINHLIVGSPVGGLGFRGINGALFLDIGQAWDRDYRFSSVLGSVGFSVRARVGGFLVFRFDIGKIFQIRGLTDPRVDFNGGLKKAFWFGFDF